MNKPDHFIKETAHRPWPLPEGPWRYYQEWNDALFLHWRIDKNDLEALTLKGVTVDTYEGQAWVSLVAFTMQQIRPRNLPSVSLISDFDEINVRTYLKKDDKAGVYFLNIEAGKSLSAGISRLLFGLPYEKATIIRKHNANEQQYCSTNKRKDFNLDVSFVAGTEILEKTELDKWLTERYCLYFSKGHPIFRYDIHHKEWPLYEVNIQKLNVYYKIGNIVLNNTPDLVHYSSGVQVAAWKKQRLNIN